MNTGLRRPRRLEKLLVIIATDQARIWARYRTLGGKVPIRHCLEGRRPCEYQEAA
jgi:hypothetical protein